jgi:hypothetical protein
MPEKYQRPHWHERVQAIERMKRAQEDERDALAVVRRFNAKLSAKRPVWFWPKVGAAITARYPWVVIACDSCGLHGDLDLRMKPRDPEAPIRIVLRDFRCPRCNGHGRPRVAGLKRTVNGS